MNIKHRPARHSTFTGGKSLHSGLSLVELMIGMTLGLFIIGGVISIFVTNQQAARATESLSRIQESSRIAFELLARDLREAGSNACSTSNRIVNVLNGPPAWSDWGAQSGILGYNTDAAFNTAFPAQATGTTTARHITNTDAITVMSSVGTGLTIDQPSPAAATFHVNKSTDGIVAAGDILMVCDYEITTIFQMTGPNAPNPTVVHNTGAGTPGNCTKGLGFPRDCSNPGNPHDFAPNAQIVRFQSATWYIGASGRNDTRGNPINSLFRMVNGGAPEEIAEGIDNMQITYLTNGATDYVDAAAGTNWADVVAARVTLTLSGIETGTRTDNTNNSRLDRTTTQTVTLRTRTQ